MAFAHQYVPHRGRNDTNASPRQTHVIPGGEDVSAVHGGAFKDALIQWNSTLPPFDMDFYTTVCCDSSFEKEYSDVQDISIKLHQNPKDSATMMEWKEKLATWRKRLLVVFLALMDPVLWPDLEKAYHRLIPHDIRRINDKVVAVWKHYPAPTHRRDRLERMSALL